jgi:hypothetical protein
VVANCATCCSRRPHSPGTRTHAVTCALCTSSAAGRSTIVSTSPPSKSPNSTEPPRGLEDRRIWQACSQHTPVARGDPARQTQNRLTGTKARDRRHGQRPDHPPFSSNGSVREADRATQRSSDNSTGVSALRDHLHRYWFTFDEPPKASFFVLGCGVTAVDREDAERLLRSAWFAADGLPRIHGAIEDVDVRDLDAGHVLPNMGDPSIRGIWYPRR